MPSILGLAGGAAAMESHPLVASQLPCWYPQHERHALKSVVIPLPPGFLDYLQEDGIFLPEDSAAVPVLDPIDMGLLVDGDYRRDDWDTQPATATGAASAPPQPSPSGPLRGGRDGQLSGSTQTSGPGGRRDGGADSGAGGVAGSDSGGDSDGEDDRMGGREGGSEAASSGGGGGRQQDWRLRFPGLAAAVDGAIAALGGRVVPKLNWSCPSDAVWVSATASLACRNVEQVALLLKSSDRVVSHDVALLARAAQAHAHGEAAAAHGEAAHGEAAHGELARAVQAHAHAAAAHGEVDARAEAAGAQAEGKSGGDSSSGCGPAAPAAPGAEGGGSPHGSPHSGHSHGRTEGADGSAAHGEDSCGAVQPGASRGGGRGGGAAVSPGPGPGSCLSRGQGEGEGGGSGGCLLRPVLVLKKWYNLRPEREFRCFVVRGRLVAACQRDVSQSFPGLTAPGSLAPLRSRLWAFWRDCVEGSLPLRDFAYDVYVPLEPASASAAGGGGVRLVDVNPLTDSTSPLLFEWAELGCGRGPGGAEPPPSAEHLLSQLLLPRAGARREGANGEARADGDDEAWMEEAAAGGSLTALPLPTRAEELQVRIVQAGGASGPGGAGGGGGLGSLLGPMLLGSRAATAMPYDMLGIADSVDKMVEVMSRQRQRQQEGRPGGSETESESEPESGSESEPNSGEGAEREEATGGRPVGARGGGFASLGGGGGESGGGGDPPSAELAALFGRRRGGDGEGEGDEGGADEDARVGEAVAEIVGMLGPADL